MCIRDREEEIIKEDLLDKIGEKTKGTGNIESQFSQDDNANNQIQGNLRKLNLNEDKPDVSQSDINETINQSITITDSEKGNNKKVNNTDIKEGEASQEDNIEGPIPPWIR